MFKILRRAAFLSAFLWAMTGFSAPSMAAPFCLTIQPGVSAQCIYYDVGQCFKDADRMGAQCTGNVDFMQSNLSARFVGPGQFCLMDSFYFVSCIYQTQQECFEEISRDNRGVCVQKDNVDGTLLAGDFAERNQEASILSGLDALATSSAASPNASSFDPLKPFDLNINNKGSSLDLNN